MKRIALLILVLSVGSVATTQAAQAEGQDIDPKANDILRDATRYLAESPFFGLTAEVWHEQMSDSGEKFQFTREVEMEIKRPDRLHAEIHSPHSQRGFWYDGKSLTVLDRKRNVFSATPMPRTIDAALDKAHEEFSIDLPLIDLAVSDPYANATAKVRTGKYLGLAVAMGYTCHHLAFTQDNIDWQVWIQDGPQPLIRKFVINHKTEPGSPEFTGLIRSWDLTDRISDYNFVFSAPRGAMKVRMREDKVNPELGGAPAVQPRVARVQPKQ